MKALGEKRIWIGVYGECKRNRTINGLDTLNMTPIPLYPAIFKINCSQVFAKVAAFLPFIVSWSFSIRSCFEWNMEVTAQPLKWTILLTLIIVFHSGTACVGGRWGEMWHGVASSVGDSISILPLNKCADELNQCCGGGVNPIFLCLCVCGHLQKC